MVGHRWDRHAFCCSKSFFLSTYVLTSWKRSSKLSAIFQYSFPFWTNSPKLNLSKQSRKCMFPHTMSPKLPYVESTVLFEQFFPNELNIYDNSECICNGWLIIIVWHQKDQNLLLFTVFPYRPTWWENQFRCLCWWLSDAESWHSQKKIWAKTVKNVARLMYNVC